MSSSKVSSHCDYSMMSQWEKSFLDKDDYERMKSSNERRKKKRVQARTWFFTMHVEYGNIGCLERTLKLMECEYLVCTKIERATTIYVEGIVRWTERSRSHIYTHNKLIVHNPAGVIISRLLYNNWEQWYGNYHDSCWFEVGEKGKFWKEVDRKTQSKKPKETGVKRKRDEEVNIDEIDITDIDHRLNRLIEGSKELQDELRKKIRMELEESDTEIDEPDLR